MIQKGKSVRKEIIKVIEQRKENAAGSGNGKRRPVSGVYEKQNSQKLLTACGCQNFKMASKTLPPGIHAQYNSPSFSVNRTCDCNGIVTPVITLC